MQNVEVAAHPELRPDRAHAADGKTSLGEALLHAAGATPALGSVDAKTSVPRLLARGEGAPATRSRRARLRLRLGRPPPHARRHARRPELPGRGSRSPGGVSTARVLVVSAVDGVKVGTESMWRAAERAGVPVVAFVNGLDRDRADFAAAVESLRTLDANAGGAGATDRRGTALDGRDRPRGRGAPSWTAREVDIPAERAVRPPTMPRAAAGRGGGRVRRHAAREVPRSRRARRRRGSARPGRRHARAQARAGALRRRHSRVGRRCSAIAELLPRRRPPPRPSATARRCARADAPFAALVFKTVADRYAGTLSVLRVVSGTLRPDGTLTNATRGGKERVGKLLLLRGAEHVDVPEAGPGDVIAVAKLKDVPHRRRPHAGEGRRSRSPPIPIPSGVLSYAVSAKSRAGRGQALHRARPPRGGGPDAPARRATRAPASSCSPAWASSTSGSTVAAAAPALRGRGRAARRRRSRTGRPSRARPRTWRASSRSRPAARACTASAT